MSGLQIRHWRNDETLFTHARAVTRNNYLAETIVGSMLLSRGRVEAARQCYANALRVRPAYPEALSGMGDVMAAQGRERDALALLQPWLQADPNVVEALRRAAWIKATSPDAAIRDGAEAVILAARACELTGQRHPPSLAALAAAYGETGRFEDALRTVQKAEALAAGPGLDRDLGERLQRLKSALEARQAYRRESRP